MWSMCVVRAKNFHQSSAIYPLIFLMFTLQGTSIPKSSPPLPTASPASWKFQRSRPCPNKRPPMATVVNGATKPANLWGVGLFALVLKNYCLQKQRFMIWKRKNTTQSFRKAHQTQDMNFSSSILSASVNIPFFQAEQNSREVMKWPAFNPCVVFEAMSWAMASSTIGWIFDIFPARMTLTCLTL